MPRVIEMPAAASVDWLEYAENSVAPLRRKPSGSNMPKIHWPDYAER